MALSWSERWAELQRIYLRRSGPEHPGPAEVMAFVL